MKRTIPAPLARLLPLSVTLLAILLDQLTKALATAYLKPIGTFPIIENALHFTYRTNTGGAFSIFAAPEQRWILMTVSTLALIGMLVFLFKAKELTPLARWSLAAVIGGGIGNMIDRIFVGYVVDFLDFRLINFAVFNVADCFVCVGVGFLALAIILSMSEEQKQSKATQTAGEAHDDHPLD